MHGDWSLLLDPVSLTLGASVAGAMWLSARDVTPEQAILPSLLVSYLRVAMCERFVPLRRRWRRSRGDLQVDAGLALLGSAMADNLSRVLLPVGGAALRGLTAGAGFSFWSGQRPPPLQLPVAELPGLFSNCLAPFRWPRVEREACAA